MLSNKPRNRYKRRIRIRRCKFDVNKPENEYTTYNSFQDMVEELNKELESESIGEVE